MKAVTKENITRAKRIASLYFRRIAFVVKKLYEESEKEKLNLHKTNKPVA